jgi:molecular chaperone DnaK (HSP70)
MVAEETTANGTAPADRHAIGISFGNSNSSIAYTTIEDKAEVIANEEGGKFSLLLAWLHANCVTQTVKFHQYCPILTVKNIMALKQRHNSYETARILWHTSEIFSDKSEYFSG